MTLIFNQLDWIAKYEKKLSRFKLSFDQKSHFNIILAIRKKNNCVHLKLEIN